MVRSGPRSPQLIRHFSDANWGLVDRGRHPDVDQGSETCDGAVYEVKEESLKPVSFGEVVQWLP